MALGAVLCRVSCKGFLGGHIFGWVLGCIYSSWALRFK